jgi:hypothetical protein
MCDEAEEFFSGQFIEELKKQNKKLVVQYKVAETINRLQNKEDDKETRHKAKKAAKLLNKLIKDGLIEGRGSKEDSIANHTFIKVFTDYLNKMNLCLITQNRKLAFETVGLTKSNSVNTFSKVKAFRIDNNSKLDLWRFNSDEINKKSSNNRRNNRRRVRVRCHICKKWYEDNKDFVDNLIAQKKDCICKTCAEKLLNK